MFGAVKSTKQVDVDLYQYSGYGIRFDREGTYSISDEVGRNVIIFRVDMSSSPHIDNKKRDTLIVGKGPTQELKHTLTAGKLYAINFTKVNRKFCLSLHYNGAIVIDLLMVQKLFNLKQKILKLQYIPCVLETFQKTGQ